MSSLKEFVKQSIGLESKNSQVFDDRYQKWFEFFIQPGCPIKTFESAASLLGLMETFNDKSNKQLEDLMEVVLLNKQQPLVLH